MSRCPSCGTELSVATESCPVCMLRKGLAGGTESGESFCEEPLGPALEQGAQRFEHYEIVQGDDGKPIELGRGAMGVTYKAIHVDLRSPVTLKVISEKYLGDESARLRFLREARAAASVRHPNVASVFHLGRTGPNYYYAMEFVEGETLEKLIRRSGRLEVKLALEIAAQAAAGLAAVQKQKLVHRDIKPSNIMVNLEDGNAVRAKIIDLGLAKPADEPGSESGISMPGMFVGTPEFASPEQFAGIDVDIRSDLYSLGVTIWQMVTGHPVFRGSPAELMYQHQHAPLPVERLQDVPQPVVVLLGILLEKDPAKRFRTPNELLPAISAVLQAVEARRTLEPPKLRADFVRKSGDRSRKSVIARVSKRSIAVLPFVSLSNDKKNAYFADGIHDEILSNLAKVSQLKVISRTSVMTYRESGNRDLRSIAGQLGVANVVEGTVRKDGHRIRITIRLVDARTDETLWADTYDRDLIDIFLIQSEIAQTVALKLSARLSPTERREIEDKPTSDMEAYDLYLQARELIVNCQFQMRDERQSLLSALRFLEEATRRDPQFALAYSLIGRANDALYWTKIDQTPARRALADAAENQAMRLRPDLSEVHLRAAWRRFVHHQDDRALAQLAIARKNRPNDPVAIQLLAFIDRRQGRWEDAISGLRRALSLDPRHPIILGSLRETYYWLRRYREVEESCDREMELAPEKTPLKAYKASVAFEKNADLTSYRVAMDQLPPSSKNTLWITSLSFQGAILARDWREAKEILRNSPYPELFFAFSPYSWSTALVPRACHEIWLAALQGEQPTMETGFGQARAQLKQKVEAESEDPALLSVLGLIDAALGRQEEAIEEAKQAVRMLPISRDAVEGPSLVSNLAAVYAWTSHLDLAFQELMISVHAPGGIHYGELKLDPTWDPLRPDPRFEKLLGQLEPQSGVQEYRSTGVQ
jgi:serine/threonine protein kinase/tetratricopeptide (TPR) repeat protein